MNPSQGASSRKTPPSPDAFDSLIEHHSRIRAMAQRIESTSDVSLKKTLLEQLAHEIEAHFYIEESFVYPALETLHPNKIAQKRLVDSFWNDHDSINGALTEQIEMPLDDPDFKTDLKHLVIKINRHFRREEEELYFPARLAIEPTDLKKLSAKIQSAQASSSPSRDPFAA